MQKILIILTIIAILIYIYHISYINEYMDATTDPRAKIFNNSGVGIYNGINQSNYNIKSDNKELTDSIIKLIQCQKLYNAELMKNKNYVAENESYRKTINEMNNIINKMNNITVRAYGVSQGDLFHS